MDKRQWTWLIAIVGAVVASLWYRVTVWQRLEQTSALFIGIPALIAAICVLTPKPASATGTAVKAVTLFIGISGIFLGEGLICILMAAPLFYLVAILIGYAADKHRKNSTIVSCVLILTMIPISSEGTRPRLSFSREETVSAERVLAATPDQINAALAAPPRTNGVFPFYLRLGFPRPVSADVHGTGVGARETIHFAGGEGKPGDLVLEVAEHREGRLRWRSISDTSHVAHWLTWEDSTVEWVAVDVSHTRVRWTLHYRRLLDPAWYFRPWERYAARLTAEQLIQDAATSR
ncbi:MAG: Polyketide cyclase/dehydrase [Candidatus Acidoferrum typicum]|nr:Polyketide cyclase/dehydrase [Candidatus Acidoferrum typicum]